jgi:hypothetical protein
MKIQKMILMTEFYKLKSRFEAKYVPDPNSGCWLWIGAVDVVGFFRHNVAEFFVNAPQFQWGRLQKMKR